MSIPLPARVSIRTATAEDIHSFYGMMLPQTVRAFVVELDGKIACIAGVTIERGRHVAFSDVLEDLQAPKKMRWRVAVELMRRMKEMRLPFMAACDPESVKFLKRLGFTKAGKCDAGEVYECRP